MTHAADDPAPIEYLLSRFDLEVLDRDLFLGDPGPGDRRLFGGLVAAQSYMAAARTVEDPTPNRMKEMIRKITGWRGKPDRPSLHKF